jgi:cation transport regulator
LIFINCDDAEISIIKRLKIQLVNREMPYASINELPNSVRLHLPKHAQEIYKSAFNNAWEEYKSENKRRTKETREEVSHKVAWSAVKTKYVKSGDKWILIQ